MLRASACMQSIADLGMGERFRDLARQITLDVHGVLSGMLYYSDCGALPAALYRATLLHSAEVKAAGECGMTWGHHLSGKAPCASHDIHCPKITSG